MKKKLLTHLFPTILVFFSLVYFAPSAVHSTSVDISGSIGGEMPKTGQDIEEPNPITPSEELASPYEDIIVLRQFPTTGEHSTYFSLIGLGILLLLLLLGVRSNIHIVQKNRPEE